MSRFHVWALLGALALPPSAFAADDAEAVRDWLKMIELDSGPTVRARLAAGQDPNVMGEKGHPALHWALRHQSDAAFKALLDDPRTNVNLPNAQGESPLALAALRGKLAWVKALVARGAVVNVEPGTLRWQALHYAASGPDGGVTAWLLDQGADINAPSPNGSTPLMLAWGYGAVDAAKLLMERGAKADLRNQQGLSAWDFAKRAGREDLAKRAGLSKAP